MSTKGTEVNRLKNLALSTGDKYMMTPESIVIDPTHNPRDYTLQDNREHLNALKINIKANGVLMPLLVRFDGSNKQAILVDGECRLRACLELIQEGVPIKSIPCVSAGRADNETDRLVMAVAANTGKQLNKWELGSAFRRLEKYGHTVDQISERTGYTPRIINEAMELDAVPEDMKKMLAAHEVTPAKALQSIRREGGATKATSELKKAVAAAKKEGKTTVKAERKTTESEVLKLAKQVVKSARADLDLVIAGDPSEYVSVFSKLMVKLDKAINGL